MADFGWSDKELDASVRAYLWMLKCEEAGHTPIKAKVRRAMVAGPLGDRSDKSLEYRFQNISSVLHKRGRSFMRGYKPASNVGASVDRKLAEIITNYDEKKPMRRMDWLLEALPDEVVYEAAEQLSQGREFDYPPSVDYVVKHKGKDLPPKKVTALPAQSGS